MTMSIFSALGYTGPRDKRSCLSSSHHTHVPGWKKGKDEGRELHRSCPSVVRRESEEVL